LLFDILVVVRCHSAYASET